MTRNICFCFIILMTISARAQTLVMPGDYPDPSVVKIGDSYFASATSSNWAPAFPLLESKDLFNWDLKNYIFNALPAWADYYFWAPEISSDNGRVYVYYSAHKRGGNLCVGIASADSIGGKFKDHGPIMCEEVGSIDAFPMRDENEKLYLIWKRDGNSVNQPTPILAKQLNEARTQTVGKEIELFRNDAAWEGNLVEGVSMIRHNGFFYAFYSASGCCGRACTYGIGIARAKNLLGPWEKFSGNPILTNSANWKCNGHGTVVEKQGRFYFLHHAYDSATNIFVGRQGVLMEFVFTDDGWVKFVKSPLEKTNIPSELLDSFNGTDLSPYWQWSIFSLINYTMDKGLLNLNAQPTKSGAYIGQRVYTENYTVDIKLNLSSDAETGVALIGDEKNLVYASRFGKKIQVVKLEADKETIIREINIKTKETINLRMTVEKNSKLRFFWSKDGNQFTPLHESLIEADFLPPWDRGVRAGIISKGETHQKSVIQEFRLQNKH
jgi:xylan 1,4-beta-xylosidase